MALDPDTRGAIAYQRHRDALIVRYFHPALSLSLLLVGLGLFFLAEGAERRAWWESFGLLLGANGASSVLGIPVLIALTSRWRRASERAFEHVELDADRAEVVVRVGRGDVHRITRDRVASVSVENMPGELRRLVLTMKGRPVGDRYVLAVPPPMSEALVAFIGPRPVAFDIGSRSLWSAGWVFTFSYAASSAAALVGSSLLRPHVPRMIFEPYASTESVGWILGFGVAVFGLAHAVLGLLTRPPSIRIGVDGLSVTRYGRTRFWSWSNVEAVERAGPIIELVRADGRRDRIGLRAVESRAIDSLVRAIRVRSAAAGDVDSTPDDGEAPPTASAYRLHRLDESELEARLVAPTSSRGRRVRVAQRLAAMGSPGREALRISAVDIAEPALRHALEHLAESERAAEDEVEAAAVGRGSPRDAVAPASFQRER